MTEDCESFSSEIKSIQIQLTINIVATFASMNVSERAWFFIQKNITMWKIASNIKLYVY